MSFWVFNPGVEIRKIFWPDITLQNCQSQYPWPWCTCCSQLFTSHIFVFVCAVCTAILSSSWKNNTLFTVSKIQRIRSIRKLNNPTANSFLSVFRFNLQYILNGTHWYTPFLTKKPIKKPCGQGFFGVYFCVICLVWIQKLKQPMISIKVMAKNLAYCGFQRQLCTEKMTTY